MKAKNQFTMQLANGQEQTFESAADMVAWMDRQRGLQYPGRRNRRKPAPQRKATKLVKQTATNNSTAPLARYANRNSDEA